MPVSAVVGQDDARLGVLLAAVDPGIGGVLLSGEKGTAKTTLVRGLADVLPGIIVVAKCRFSCDPAGPDPACPDGPHPSGAAAEYRPALLVELPLGGTEDRVTGSLDVPRVLAGAATSEAFVPGLLALAHRGVLYVDEINLLPDHLVDMLLDAAATGTAVVEREGISLRHACRFLLVGTMNPEEGELRPQLHDRFGLCVPVTASADPRQRAAAGRARLDGATGGADDPDPPPDDGGGKPDAGPGSEATAPPAQDHSAPVGTADDPSSDGQSSGHSGASSQAEAGGQRARQRTASGPGPAFRIRHLQATGVGSASGGHRSPSRGAGGRPTTSIATTSRPDLAPTVPSAALARPAQPFLAMPQDRRRCVRPGRRSTT